MPAIKRYPHSEPVWMPRPLDARDKRDLTVTMTASAVAFALTLWVLR